MSDLTTTQIYYETREFCHRDVYKHLRNLRKAIIELKLNFKKTVQENALYYEKEIERVKQEKDEEWRKIYHRLETENETLKSELRNLTVSDTKDMWDTEGEIADLHKKLDQKEIQINQLQSALAEQSKAMLQMEKNNVLNHLKYKSRRVCIKDLQDQQLKDFNHCIIENQCSI